MSGSNHLHVERHPWKPFLPHNAKLLMLGSFPPKPERWSMEFYYPNFQNDMWRVVGLVFFDDPERFADKSARRFKYDDIVSFCAERGIALADTALEAVRLKDNASDQFLDVVTAISPETLLEPLPQCRIVAATGQKAAELFAASTGFVPPAVGLSCTFSWNQRDFTFFRMPSTSRAFPKPLAQKAVFYRQLFRQAGLL